MPIRVLIADDHAMFRGGVRMLLEAQPDMEIVGEAATGREAVRLAEELTPDVVIMDASMPDMDGFEATQEIKKKQPQTAVLALTMFDDDAHFLRMLSLGASGYIPKKAAPDDLVFAIRSVHGGGAYLFPTAARALISDYLHRAQAGEEKASYDGLTDREREVLRLIAEGLPGKEIAEKLGISVSTVERHRANIMEKLDLHTRTALVKYAIRRKLITLEP